MSSRKPCPMRWVLLLAVWTSGCGAPPWSRPEAPSATRIAAERRPLVVAVNADGALEATQASPVAVPPVPTGALTVKELVPEGSLVTEGDVVVRFDDSQLTIDLENHAASFRSAETRIDRTQIQAAIESGQTQVLRSVAELELDHATSFRIDDASVYSRLDILENQLQADRARETILFADASLLLKGEYHDIDERILEVEKKSLEGKMERVEQSLGHLVLRSPIGGMVVYKKNWRGSTVSVGDSLWPGNVIMSIVDPSSVELRAFVLERDATGVAAGAAAVVHVDALPGRAFPGRVTSVANLSRPIERGSPVKYFEVAVALDEGDPGVLKPGMRGSARITTGELPDALVIPRAALRGSDADPHVLVDGPDGPQSRRVVLGPGDHACVSIESGLAAGEAVLLGGAEGTGAGDPGSVAWRRPARDTARPG